MADINIFVSKIPLDPFLYIYLSKYTEDGDRILLSPKITFDKEIDEVINSLIVKLEKVRKKAKTKLKKLK